MKNQHNKSFYILVFFAFLLASCAKQNASIVKQTYHDLTGHYNTYFNANELYKTTIQSIEENRSEDYSEILPLYAYGTMEDTQAQSGEFQTAQEKAAKSIQLHKISNWADDAFLIVGKTYYMQGEYDKAIESFRYITANYKEGVDGRSDKKIRKQKNSKKKKEKAKKKEDKDIDALKDGKDIRPSNGLFLHEPSRSEALVWMIKSFTSNEQYQEAEAILTFVRSDKDFFKNYDKDVELVNAFYYLEQGKNEKAIEHLEASLELIKRQKKKARYQFILGQLYGTTGNQAKAAEYYKQSIKANSNFEMQFYAKLNLIKMSHSEGYDKSDAQKLIAKMLKDKKNRNFYDQLYYEQALFALEDNEKEEAKDLLGQSIEASVDNSSQKATSYVLLAQLNYEEEKYVPAQALYDSSLAIIDSDFDNYEFILNRSNVLTDLVTELNTINTNDSLLRIAAMPEKEQYDYLYLLAVEQVEAEDQAQTAASNALGLPQDDSNDKKGSWYFYSEGLKAKGYKSFQEQWGARELEDDWRRADKSSSAFTADNDSTATTILASTDIFGRIDQKLEMMLAELPQSDEDKKGLKNDIIDAHYEAAMIYKDGLDNIPKSIQMLEALLAGYSNNVYEAESFYQLYLMYADLDNKAKSDKYKNLLLGEYKDSDFAKILKDPSYLDEIEEKQNAVFSYYEKSYEMYGNEQYEQVISRCEKANGLYPENTLQAKFDLLKAIAIGGRKELAPYETSLEYVVETHQDTEEQAKAEELLAYLRGEVPAGDGNLNGSSNNGSDSTDKPAKIDNTIDIDDKLLDDKKKGLQLKLGDKSLQLGGKDKVNLKGDNPK